MGHTSREKSKLLGRVRRIRGQVEALERSAGLVTGFTARDTGLSPVLTVAVAFVDPSITVTLALP